MENSNLNNFCNDLTHTKETNDDSHKSDWDGVIIPPEFTILLAFKLVAISKLIVCLDLP